MRALVAIILAMSAYRCGIEAGNAGTGKGKSGNVQIYFAQQQSTSNESMNVQISSLGLVQTTSTSETSLGSSVNSVDLFASTSNANVPVVNATSVPVGTYSQIAIRLKGDKPIHYRDAEGGETDLGVSDATDQAFYLTQAIEVSENQTISIVVNLDPYKSIQSGDGGRKAFKPRGNARPRDQVFEYSGTTTVAGAKWICAYAYKNGDWHEGGMPLQGSVPTSPLPPEPADDHRGSPIEDLPTFVNKSGLIKDTTSECDHAFAKVPVVDGVYSFHQLQPVSYALRIFKSHGSYVDIDADIDLNRSAHH
ncbi:MAG: DUF4382 domain-containing protein [Chitinophagaceae bacterium]|nr:DUF4382 domain-containing protein [Oligoflexus sp.]